MTLRFEGKYMWDITVSKSYVNHFESSYSIQGIKLNLKAIGGILEKKFQKKVLR